MNPTYVLRNKVTNKFGLALAYLLMGAVVLSVGSLLIVAPAVGIAKQLGAPPIVGQLIGGALAMAFAAFTIVFAMRDFHKNVAGNVTLDSEKVALPTLRGQIEIPLSEIESIHFRKDGRGLRLAIRQSNGKRHVFPKWFSQAPDMSEGIQNTIVPAIAERLAATVHQGQEIPLTENRFAAFGRFIFGLLMAPVALILILSIYGAVTGASLMRDCIDAIGAGARGMRRNLVLDASGLRRGNTSLQWKEIASITADGYGSVIRTTTGKRWHISMFSENFLPLNFLVGALSGQN